MAVAQEEFDYRACWSFPIEAPSGLMTPPCGVPAVRGMMLPSSICTHHYMGRLFVEV
jgi:hypothetical protein